MGWIARQPERSCLRPRAQLPAEGTPADQLSQARRVTSASVGSATANTNKGGARGTCDRNHKGTGVRRREVVASSYYL
jgi:hypothetical protein